MSAERTVITRPCGVGPFVQLRETYTVTNDSGFLRYRGIVEGLTCFQLNDDCRSRFTTLGDRTMNNNTDGLVGFLVTMFFLLSVGLVGAIVQIVWNLLK